MSGLTSSSSARSVPSTRSQKHGTPGIFPENTTFLTEIVAIINVFGINVFVSKIPGEPVLWLVTVGVNVMMRRKQSRDEIRLIYFLVSLGRVKSNSVKAFKSPQRFSHFGLLRFSFIFLKSGNNSAAVK